MRLTLMKAKLHRATVTAADLQYEGSIALGPDLRRAAGLLEYERVEIFNVTNGQRFATYVINSRRPGEVMINGAAARLVQPGDHVIIVAYADFSPDEAATHKPTVVLLDGKNRPQAKLRSSGRRLPTHRN